MWPLSLRFDTKTKRKQQSDKLANKQSDPVIVCEIMLLMNIIYVRISIERNLINIYIDIIMQSYIYTHIHTHVLKYSRTQLYFTFSLRRQTAMEIQKGIATVLYIYIFLMNVSTDKAFNTITAPIRFFFAHAQDLSYKIYHIYRASRITLLCVIFLIIVRLRFSNIIKERLHSTILRLLRFSS